MTVRGGYHKGILVIFKRGFDTLIASYIGECVYVGGAALTKGADGEAVDVYVNDVMDRIGLNDHVGAASVWGHVLWEVSQTHFPSHCC